MDIENELLLKMVKLDVKHAQLEQEHKKITQFVVQMNVMPKEDGSHKRMVHAIIVEITMWLTMKEQLVSIKTVLKTKFIQLMVNVKHAMIISELLDTVTQDQDSQKLSVWNVIATQAEENIVK